MNRVKKHFTILVLLFFVLVFNLSTYVYTFSEYVSKIETVETGIKDNVVTINDLENDYNYYMGLNYVSSDGTLPTTENKNLYNENNLVEVKLSYYGTNIEKELTGYVSLTEEQDTFVYYKMYPVNNNGTEDTSDDYIEIELIDNPFTDRPDNMGFNGWITDYENAVIRLEKEYYVRYAKVPVTYRDNIPDSIAIDFYAAWINAKVGLVNATSNWDNAFNSLDNEGMQAIGGEKPIYESVAGLYLQYTASFGSNYPSGAVGSNGSSLNGRCSSFFSSCTYYLVVDEGSEYDSSLTYYQLSGNGNNRTMREYDVSITGYETIPYLEEGTVLTGYYRQVNLNNKNIGGYYSSEGEIQESRVCTSNCTYYELIGYYDDLGNINRADGNTLYYYLATRDTNIIVMNGSVSTKWDSDKPFTLTSVHNDTSYTNSVTWTVSNQYITCYADTVIENIKINSNANNSSNDPASNSTTTRYIYANYNNLKIGRGIVQSNSSKTFNGIFGGNNDTTAVGSASDPIKYRLMVESGWYNSITLTNGPSNTNRTKYIEAKGIYGSDYDRVSGKDNVEVYFETAGSWGAGNYYASANTGITFDAIIKSGKYGTGKSDHTTGVYVGGRSYGTHYTSRRIKVEGGWIYNLIGGPLTASNRANINDTYIYMTGGSIDMITGGAGTSTTYGNRIISITGGTVNYSVFGGSNSYSGGSSDGKLTGSSFVYIGGNATIGNKDYVDSANTLWGAEAGSVFGIGNGNDSSSTIGSNENSNIIIDGECNILGNVYGGGNYSATGAETTQNSTTTNIKILGGTINGSVYGGGNNNGSGTSDVSSTINIEFLDGIVNGSVYGGSKAAGTIYGNVDISITGGTFNNSIFGGGQGNLTYVTKNVDITFGSSTTNDLTLVNSLYGGSEYGTTNGTTEATNNQTNITINSGTVKGAIYGGAKGDASYVPNVLGNVKVIVNDGNINNVFGANDFSGTLAGTSEIYLNGGTVSSVYGGGNKTAQNITNIYLQGSEVTNIFGGSNETGNVNTSNITVASGKATNIYGGNNIGGVTTNSLINLNGGLINTVYGGGNKTSLTKSTINLNGSEVTNIFGGSNETGNVNDSNIIVTSGKATNIYGGNNIGGVTTNSLINLNGGTIKTVYGGGNKTSLTESTINLDGSEVTNIFGGSNETGEVDASNIIVTSGSVTNIYGGNNIGGVTSNSSINLNGGIIATVYGGGNKTSLTESTINLNGSEVTNIFGGSNESGDVNVSDITVTSGSVTTIYGGNNQGGSTNDSYITINGGNIDSIYGGGASAPVINTNIVVNSSNITNIFGGSNNSGDVSSSKINIYDGIITNIYGGNNTGGTTDETFITIEDAKIDNIYGGGNNTTTITSNLNIYDGIITNIYGGGNNVNGITTTTNLNLNGGIITNLYGGGNKASTTTSNIKLNGSNVVNLYGGGNESGVDEANVNLYSGLVNNVFGGSNTSGEVKVAKINTNDVEDEASSIDMSLNYALAEVNPYWQNTDYKTVATIDVTITNNGANALDSYEGYISLSNSELYSNYSSTEIIDSNGMYTFNQINKYDSNSPNVINPGESYTFQFSIYSKLEINEFKIIEYKLSGYDSTGEKLTSKITDLIISDIYGGNNQGGTTDVSAIILNRGEYDNIFGGGNQAISNNPSINIQNITVNERIYGGGNQALVTNNTSLKIKKCNIKGSVFGGGNAGAVGKDSNIYISDSEVLESIYGGGNGSTAIIKGNVYLSIDGDTTVTKHVFGSGNAANTGLESLANSKTILNIAGATIDGNVYGGGNTSVVYGTTNVNIGIDTITNKSLIEDNIVIGGTVFGGGEANEQGSEIYDYSFISVTDGTYVNINGNNHNELTIGGSIFGSGNASSTEGYSYINVANYGSEESYKSNISIQRADMVVIDNSAMELIGTTDRTNEYSSVLFSLSRIKHLKLKNNSILYLNNGSNLLEELTSAVDIDGIETLQAVSFKDNEVIKNSNNKIFIQSGKNLNIATTENATTYGKVNGMSFFGMYTKDRDNNILTGVYDEYQTGDEIGGGNAYLFDAGSYVLGIHKINHDTKTDGFYSNFVKDGIVTVDYIKPTPDDSTYYMWSIGEQVVSVDLYLTASKYLTLGTEELGMLNYSAPNTTFSIVGFSYNNLDSKVSLLEEAEIPRIADTTEDADNVMSLVMKPVNSGWITKGETSFLTSDKGVSGTTFYKSENSTEVPTFQFYLYHSKNLGTSGNMGSVTISFVVSTPIDDITNNVERVNLVINLDRQLYNTNDYEASMTNGKAYDLFASSNVNLTSDGSFSAYYSLFAQGNESLYKEGYHRSLVSTYAFPVNTKLTLVNLSEDNVNEYYYYVVTENDFNKAKDEVEQYKECAYDFSKFIRMGSTSSNNNFNDAINNSKYYDSSTGISFEEFIVIVDFAQSNITEDVLEQMLLIELRNDKNNTVVSVLGIEQEKMVYSLYADSRAVIDVEGTLSTDKVYPGKSVTLNVTTNFNRQIIDSKIIYDTNYFDQQLGLKITYLDSNNNQVTGASLLGVTYEYDGVTYYPRMDGSTRIRLAEKMANVSANIIINTTESVATGDYTMVIESFASPDGIYSGGVSSDSDTKPINILNTVYGLTLNMGDYLLIRDSETGENLNKNNDFRFNVKYSSALSNPRLRISLYRRNYDSVYSTDYELVDLQEYVEEILNTTNNQYEYLLTDTPLSDITYGYTLKQNLKTGTYKFVLSLYDGNTYIGDVYKYLIIKERYNG